MTDYRIDIVAGNVADVVECVGGWIFDRVMQGWAVNVVVPRPDDARAIEILGASVNRPKIFGGQASTIFLQEAPGTGVVTHRLSAAARRFKAQAMIAAGLARDTGVEERLFARPPSATGAVKVIELHAVTAAMSP
jgi:hypothetical protein